MPGSRRLSILAAIGILVAGCASGAGSSPTPSAIPTVVPTATAPTVSPAVTVVPRPSQTPSIENTCPQLDPRFAVPTVRIEPFIGHFGFEFPVGSLHPISDSAITFTPSAPSSLEDWGGSLPGGYDLRGYLWIEYPLFTRETMAPIELGSLTVLVHLEGHPPIRLNVKADLTNVTLWTFRARDVPDLDAAASLEFSTEWTDRCFAYSARGTHDAIKLLSTTTTAGCSMEPDQFWDDFRATMNPALKIDQVPVRLGAPFVDAKYIPEENPGIDAFAAYAWDPDALPIAASPNDVLIVGEDMPGLDLSTMKSIIWTRRSVVAAVKDYPPEGLVEVQRHNPHREVDGTFHLKVPGAAGPYVAWLSFDFDSTCATGTTWAVFSLTIAEPAPASVPPSPLP